MERLFLPLLFHWHPRSDNIWWTTTNWDAAEPPGLPAGGADAGPSRGCASGGGSISPLGRAAPCPATELCPRENRQGLILLSCFPSTPHFLFAACCFYSSPLFSLFTFLSPAFSLLYLCIYFKGGKELKEAEKRQQTTCSTRSNIPGSWALLVPPVLARTSKESTPRPPVSPTGSSGHGRSPHLLRSVGIVVGMAPASCSARRKSCRSPQGDWDILLWSPREERWRCCRPEPHEAQGFHWGGTRSGLSTTTYRPTPPLRAPRERQRCQPHHPRHLNQ